MTEFSRSFDVRALPGEAVTLDATADECAALARRFALVAVHSLHAEITLIAAGGKVSATGRLKASIVQTCAISGDDLPVQIDEPVKLRFVPAAATHRPDEEVELDAGALDETEYQGTLFDLGEELAQGLAVAIDPFLAGPNAEEARRKAGLLNETASGPFAALAGLKAKLD
ncbi:DUF177 domain-containing protein [Novosphingobium sp.]|uniref:YceD family protein n=1 Tax=Novosphingobium sp. TaxID=1874826 RepID=UPI00273329B2|nr:DUF177 domain-containing protein [Novosphingobium sp.]MDP3905593.1 DUF177 domain-containing protein [Novosphingobium sp.]